MRSAGVAPNVWWGTALAGLVLAVLVWAVWPEPASPMEPAANAPAHVITEDAGPPPVPAESELEPGYVAESPEELGAEPLPGAELTPEPSQPVAG